MLRKVGESQGARESYVENIDAGCNAGVVGGDCAGKRRRHRFRRHHSDHASALCLFRVGLRALGPESAGWHRVLLRLLLQSKRIRLSGAARHLLLLQRHPTRRDPQDSAHLRCSLDAPAGKGSLLSLRWLMSGFGVFIRTKSLMSLGRLTILTAEVRANLSQ